MELLWFNMVSGLAEKTLELARWSFRSCHSCERGDMSGAGMNREWKGMRLPSDGCSLNGSCEGPCEARCEGPVREL